MENDKLKNLLRSSGKSMYRVAKDSGLPYSIVNDLVNGKKDINKCTTETAVRIAAAFDVSVYDIVNPIDIMDGTAGEYRHVKYRWVYGKTMDLHVNDHGTKTVIVTKYRFQDPRKARVYRGFTRFYIDEYLEDRDFHEQAARIKTGKGKRENG